MLDAWIARSAISVEFPVATYLARSLVNRTGLTWESSHSAGIDLLSVAHFNMFDEWFSMPTDPRPEAPFNTFLMMDLLEAELNGTASAYATLARNASELATLLEIPKDSDDYRVAVLHALEGGHALGGSLDALPELARKGVAMIGITHFFSKGIATSANAFPFFSDSNSSWPNQGLSEFGAELIREMESLGIIVDVTHGTAASVADILAVSSRPLVATHATSRTLGDHAYSLYDEHIQQIARDGGVIGVILMPFWLSNYGREHLSMTHGGLRDVVATIRYMVKICGTHRNVGIGSDFAGYIPGPKEISCLAQIDVLRELLMEEFDNDLLIVDDIMSNNVTRFLLENWGARV